MLRTSPTGAGPQHRIGRRHRSIAPADSAAVPSGHSDSRRGRPRDNRRPPSAVIYLNGWTGVCSGGADEGGYDAASHESQARHSACRPSPLLPDRLHRPRRRSREDPEDVTATPLRSPAPRSSPPRARPSAAPFSFAHRSRRQRHRRRNHFEVDGDPLAAEDTVAPYELNWDTTKAPERRPCADGDRRGCRTAGRRPVTNEVSVDNPSARHDGPRQRS